jgi:hypothetical protein
MAHQLILQEIQAQAGIHAMQRKMKMPPAPPSKAKIMYYKTARFVIRRAVIPVLKAVRCARRNKKQFLWALPVLYLLHERNDPYALQVREYVISPFCFPQTPIEGENKVSFEYGNSQLHGLQNTKEDPAPILHRQVIGPNSSLYLLAEGIYGEDSVHYVAEHFPRKFQEEFQNSIADGRK